ncbi:hypothetical protein PHYPSEUDO_008864 [Phytophthora pseudosyringae]|uniref:Uncharacterized protein n=1 Tax=Phytophthora pseudosyringae TaxID=221518 RepID=A0A8T1VGH3_9STRA|nr:hypothetical protein PHYPSEUDO_008864 [Phytophthora pseudosyringae]
MGSKVEGLARMQMQGDDREKRRRQERTGSGHGADTAGVATVQLAALAASAAAAAAKRPKLDEQGEDDLPAHLNVAYEMERATSRDGDDPAGGDDDKKVGGDRSEDEKNLDMLAIATDVLLSLKRRDDSTHHQASVSGNNVTARMMTYSSILMKPMKGRMLCGSVVELIEVAFTMVELTVAGFALVDLTAVAYVLVWITVMGFVL